MTDRLSDGCPAPSHPVQHREYDLSQRASDDLDSISRSNPSAFQADSFQRVSPLHLARALVMLIGRPYLACQRSPFHRGHAKPPRSADAATSFRRLSAAT